MATSTLSQSTDAPQKGKDVEARAVRSSGFNERSVTNGITAFATGGQASAVQLVSELNVVSTVGTAADSVKLPDAIVGRVVIVKNAAAANSLNIYPKTGEAVNALAANAAYALVVTKSALFFCTVAGTWHTILTA